MLSEDRGVDSCSAVFGFCLTNKMQSSLYVVTIVVLCLQFPDHRINYPANCSCPATSLHGVTRGCAFMGRSEVSRRA